MIIGLRCEMEDRRPAVNFADDGSLGSCSPYRRATVTLSDDASVGSYSTWSTFGTTTTLSEEELAAKRAARQRRRAAHAVAQQLDFMYQEREAYRRDAPLRRKRALARKGPSDFGLKVPELAPRPVTPVLPVGNSMTGLTTKGRKKNAQLELKAAAAFLERGGKAEAVARAAAKFKNLRKGTLRTVSRGPRTRAPRLTNMRRELPEPAPQPEPSPWSRHLERRLKRDVANLHKAKPSPTHLKAKRGRAHALRLRRRLKAALGDAVLVSGGGDANLRRERAFLDALSPTGVADQQRMAAGDFRDALAKRLDYRIDHGAASDLAAFFGGHDVRLPDVPGGLQRAARLDAEKFCGAIVRGVANRASNEAVAREEELEAATARHLEWRAANKRKRKERRRRRKFDASATLSDLRASEAMVTRGDDDMRITRKLGKAIAARLDPSHPRQVRTAKLLAPPDPRRGGILHDAPSPFLTSASAPWEYKDFADLPEADQRILAELIST
jgi:hypothetical protein